MNLIWFLLCAQPLATETEDSVIRARLNLSSGFVRVLSVDHPVEPQSNSSQSKYATEYQLWFEGNRLRTVQRTGTIVGNEPLVPFDSTDSISIERRIIKKDIPVQKSIPPDSIVHMLVAEADDIVGQQSLQRFVFDARLVGLQPIAFGLLHSCTLREFVGNQIRQNSSVENTELNGDAAVLVEYSFEGGSAKIWIAEEKGYNPIRCELIAKTHEKYCIENELRQFGEVWFPSVITYREFSRDGENTEINVATVLEAEFNQDIPDSRFEPVDMKIADGTLLLAVNIPGTPTGIWDKDHFRRLKRSDFSDDRTGIEELKVPEKKRPIFFLLVALAGGLLLVVVYLFSRRK